MTPIGKMNRRILPKTTKNDTSNPRELRTLLNHEVIQDIKKNMLSRRLKLLYFAWCNSFIKYYKKCNL
ncbi:MAG: hypothetical protein ACJA2M_001731 [Polaribacter sp.]|jgi:hypothetical protein